MIIFHKSKKFHSIKSINGKDLTTFEGNWRDPQLKGRSLLTIELKSSLVNEKKLNKKHLFLPISWCSSRQLLSSEAHVTPGPIDLVA